MELAARIAWASAIAAASVGVGHAQEPDAITLYGRVFVMAESVEAKASQEERNRATPRRTRISDQSSLLGVRGTEALGGGLSAFFQLETGFKPDENNTTFAARNSAVGLACPAGTLILGRWDTPLKVATTQLDVFADLTLGGITAALNGSGIVGTQGTFDRRETNVIQYWSPTFAGLGVRLSHGVNEARVPGINPRSSGASVTYTRGPVFAGYAVDDRRDAVFLGIAPHRQSAHVVFATVAVGPVKLGGAHERIKRDGFATQRAFLANGTVSWGAHELLYQYQRARGGSDNRTQAAISDAPRPHVLVLAAGEPRCDVHAIAYRYTFTRRTFGLLQAVRVKNNQASTCNFGANPLDIGFGQDLRGYAVGLRHLF